MAMDYPMCACLIFGRTRVTPETLSAITRFAPGATVPSPNADADEEIAFRVAASLHSLTLCALLRRR